MRSLLIVTALLIGISSKLFAQFDFKTLDKETYDYFLKGDYRNLKKTADTMLQSGIDYYFLRMRLGVLAFNNQMYSSALKDFSKALEFNSLDTISRELIYKSYLFSGRKADARLYLESIPSDKRNAILKNEGKPFTTEFFAGSFTSTNDEVLYSTNSLNYEAVKSSFSINTGAEASFLTRFRGTINYTNYRKTGVIYSPSNPAGKNLNFSQDQIYAKLTGSVFPGWDFSGFGHFAFYNETITLGPQGNRVTHNKSVAEYLGGFGISKNEWKIRTGANVSMSNFSNSSQVRGEGYFTWLPKGNLNLYLTSCWMGQTDNNWGGTYQVSQEIGFKLSRSLWMESGIVKGNSFLYARNQGLLMNNSFQIPVTTIYGNIILLPWKRFNISLSPFYSRNEVYSWDLSSYTRTNKLNINSFGGSFKLIYKIN